MNDAQSNKLSTTHRQTSLNPSSSFLQQKSLSRVGQIGRDLCVLGSSWLTLLFSTSSLLLKGDIDHL